MPSHIRASLSSRLSTRCEPSPHQSQRGCPGQWLHPVSASASRDTSNALFRSLMALFLANLISRQHHRVRAKAIPSILCAVEAQPHDSGGHLAGAHAANAASGYSPACESSWRVPPHRRRMIYKTCCLPCPLFASYRTSRTSIVLGAWRKGLTPEAACGCTFPNSCAH